MTSAVTYPRYEGPEAATELASFVSAYEEVYVEPPYREGPREVADFVEHYAVQARRPGMRLVLARSGHEVVGFTYGYLLAADTRWWDNLQDMKIPEDVAREDGRRTFVIIELAVREPWRRRGIACALHDLLLDGVRTERVTLTVRPEPEAEPAPPRTWLGGTAGSGRRGPGRKLPCTTVWSARRWPRPCPTSLSETVPGTAGTTPPNRFRGSASVNEKVPGAGLEPARPRRGSEV
ncbi:hypothetical protein GCM10023220_37950 [Streptomyces ziwulingensis]|uniref:N-acetyltransferase domain-containing protein n=1 Tax=Streptomyces ziwulingensis TaxID=1045501 RepID=A0ABP9C9A4_9ACTN